MAPCCLEQAFPSQSPRASSPERSEDVECSRKGQNFVVMDLRWLGAMEKEFVLEIWPWKRNWS